MSASRSQQHGLRVTVRFHGRVVGQNVHWPRSSPVVGLTLPEAVPGSENGLLRLRWLGRDHVAIDPMVPQVPAGEVTLERGWRWRDGDAVDVDLDLVPLQRAERGSRETGDIAFLALILLLSVAVGQLEMLISLFASSGGAPAASTWEPSPEYIARLLNKDYDGADEGAPPLNDRPEHPKGAPSFYMPSGNTGPLDRVGGGAKQGDHVSRAEPAEDEDDDASDEVADGSEPKLQGTSPMLEESGTPQDGIEGAEQAEEQPGSGEQDKGEEAKKPEDPIERFVGWGFKDWFDVKDSRADPLKEDFRRQLGLVRQRLKIDPDDPWAINTLGYYAYLAENHDLGEESFQKMIKMYPDEVAGYNNLALVYKRSGEYAKEEALYRKALELDPTDEHVLNNLAVNLAHQKRYEEAEQIMAALEERSPDDPYADLHRAKVFASEGKRRDAYRYLEKALKGSRDLDTMHHIEFRQDIRLDPAFQELRHEERFARLLHGAYGADADELLRGPAPGEAPGG